MRLLQTPHCFKKLRKFPFNVEIKPGITMSRLSLCLFVSLLLQTAGFRTLNSSKVTSHKTVTKSKAAKHKVLRSRQQSQQAQQLQQVSDTRSEDSESDTTANKRPNLDI